MRIAIKGAIVPSDEGWIYDLFGFECAYPKAVEDALDQAAQTGEDVDIDINSPGGDVWSGSEIYSAIRQFKGAGNVKIHVVGVAASAASIIACAGPSDIEPTAQFMVHNVSSTAEGDYHDMDRSGNMLRQANRAIAAAYVAKSGMSEEEALQLMDEETWLTAQDAVDWGLIDEIAPAAEPQKKEPDDGAQESLRLAAAERNALLPRKLIDKMQQERSKLQAEISLLRLKGARE